jgi:nickel-dependent lactate racemase
MAMKSISLPYGKGQVSFAIPRKHFFCEVWGNEYPGLGDLEQEYRHALEHPFDSPPLSEVVKPGQTVVILVADITRSWQRNADTLPFLLQALNELGVPDHKITIIIAVGGHRQNTEFEFVEICGKEACHRLRVANHDAWDENNMTYLGRTSRGTEVSVNKIAMEADTLIMTGGVVYHFMVGYGGGRKMILPGISSIKTIRQSHLWSLGPRLGDGSNPRSVSGITRGNPAHDDMMDVCSFVKPDFVVNMVPNMAGEIAGIFAGNWVSAWLEATRLVDEIFSAEIEEQADIVIGSAGGYPRDINLYQTSKLLANCFEACTDSGVSILLSECQDITEPMEFFQWFDYLNILEMERALRAEFTIAGWVAFKTMEYCRKKMILLTKKENAPFVEKTKLIPAYTIDEALKKAYDLCGKKDPKVMIMPQGATVLPRLKRPKRLDAIGEPVRAAVSAVSR